MALVASLLIAVRRTRPGWRDALCIAAALTAMCWLGTKYAALALPVAAFFLLRADRPGQLALLAVGSVSAVLFLWFHLHVFGSLTPYGVNVVYSEWNTAQIFGGHLGFSDRYYRLWGLFVDRRFGIGPVGAVTARGSAGITAPGAKGVGSTVDTCRDPDPTADSDFRSHYHDGLVVPRPDHADGVTAPGRTPRAVGLARGIFRPGIPGNIGSRHAGVHRRLGRSGPGWRDHHCG